MLLLGLAFLITQDGCGPPGDRVPDPARPAIRDLQRSVAETGVGGMGIAIVWRGATVWTGACGYADDEGTPYSPDTRQPIGSVTKLLTAAVFASLVTEGAIDSAFAVVELVPELAARARDVGERERITLGMLASHTAGVAREPTVAGAGRGPPSRWADVLIEALPSTPLVVPAGDRFAYSNIGYATLGLALERATGTAFADLVRTRVTSPLGMTTTDTRASGSATGTAVDGGWRDTTGPRWQLSEGRGYRVPAGGYLSSTSDLARLACGLLRGFHGESSVPTALMARPRTEVGGRVAYGWGLFVDLDEATTAWHPGGVDGFEAVIALDLFRGNAVVVLRNVSGGADVLPAARGILARLALNGGRE